MNYINNYNTILVYHDDMKYVIFIILDKNVDLPRNEQKN